MAVRKKRTIAVPENITEEYYQISSEILNSFPKYRPPIDLYQFKEEIKQLYPYSRKGQRLTNEQVDEVQSLCDEERLFVSRADHPVYSEHIIKQVDLVLLDPNLKDAEIADIFIRALHMRLNAFFEQPVLPVFESLYRDLLWFTEYLWQDKHRIKLFVRRLNNEYTIVNHSLNTTFVGLWLFLYVQSSSDFKRRQLDRSALGLILHDFGMTKIPGFILNKKNALKGEEKDKIVLHPLVGFKMLQKLDLGFDELIQAIMEHHERMDGSGYPMRTRTLSKFGSLAAVADSFCSMIAARPYSDPKEAKHAARELADDKTRYDPKYTGPLANAYLTGVFELQVGKTSDAEESTSTAD